MKRLGRTWTLVTVLILITTACSVSNVSPVTSPTQSPGTTFASPSSSQSGGTVYYVRPDGGSADQCTGLVDAAYPRSGTSQPCAWDHPFRALPPGGTPRIVGGDTLIIGAGYDMVGCGKPGADHCD